MSDTPATPAEDPSAAGGSQPGGGTFNEFKRAGGALYRATEVDGRLLGLMIGAGRCLGHVRHPLQDLRAGRRLHLRRQLPDAAQPLQPVGPDRLGRGHGHRHGAHHRVAQHRPLGRLHARLPGHGHGHRAEGDPARLHRVRQLVHLAHRAGRRHRPGRSSSGAARASSSPSWASRPSSSPSAACSSGVAERSCSRAAGRSLPLDPNFSRIGGGTEGRAGPLGMDLGVGSSTLSWILGLLVVVGLVALVVMARRRRQAFDFPTRPMWAEALIIGIGTRARAGWGLGRQQLPLAGPRSAALRRVERHRGARRRSVPRHRHRLPGAHHDRGRRGS